MTHELHILTNLGSAVAGDNAPRIVNQNVSDQARLVCRLTHIRIIP